MRNYDFWKQEKDKFWNKEKIILILSWMFFKTFWNDAKFLSDRFWFKIKQTGWYETIWFPESVLEKYLKELKENNFWYLIFEKNNWILELKKKNEWWEKLKFSEENIVFLDKKENKNEFKSFLIELNIFKNA